MRGESSMSAMRETLTKKEKEQGLRYGMLALQASAMVGQMQLDQLKSIWPLGIEFTPADLQQGLVAVALGEFGNVAFVPTAEYEEESWPTDPRNPFYRG